MTPGLVEVNALEISGIYKSSSILVRAVPGQDKGENTLLAGATASLPALRRASYSCSLCVCVWGGTARLYENLGSVSTILMHGEKEGGGGGAFLSKAEKESPGRVIYSTPVSK